MGVDRNRSNSTSGRTIFWRWRFDWRGHEFEVCSDLIAHDYMRRWRFIAPWKCLRVHHILRSDDDRHFHDHPMDFTSLVLWGGYVEHTPNASPRTCRPGSIVRRRAEDLHYLKLIGTSAWTILITGPFRREWGFQTEDGWIPAREYDAYLEQRSANGVVCEYCKRVVDARDQAKRDEFVRCKVAAGRWIELCRECATKQAVNIGAQS